jgi:hypothetical protein
MSGPFCKGLFGAPNPPQHALSDLLNFGEVFYNYMSYCILT